MCVSEKFDSTMCGLEVASSLLAIQTREPSCDLEGSKSTPSAHTQRPLSSADRADWAPL